MSNKQMISLETYTARETAAKRREVDRHDDISNRLLRNFMQGAVDKLSVYPSVADAR